MANIRPFRAIRPRKGLEDQIAALPYDVYNRKEALEETKKSPLSFLRIDRAETQFSEDMDMYADCVYEKAKELLMQTSLTAREISALCGYQNETHFSRQFKQFTGTAPQEYRKRYS